MATEAAFLSLPTLLCCHNIIKKGVGDRIMTALMAWIARHAPPSAYISLIASHGSPGFYARYGFEPALLPERAGMFLRIQG
ncbi:GNAT family N-acetyltransferase [Pantoea ananatis]